MLLSRLHIRNFRGIGRIDLDLAPTTVIIGENNCGKTSVLDAITIGLGKACTGTACPFEALDFHRPPGAPADHTPEPIRIVLELAERSAGEWSEALAKPYGAAVQSLGDGRRVLRFQVVGERANAPPVRRFLDFDDQPVSGVDHDALAQLLPRGLRALHFGAHRTLWSDVHAALRTDRPEAEQVRRDRFHALYESLVDPAVRTPEFEAELHRSGELLSLASGLIDHEQSSDRITELLLSQLGAITTDSGAEMPLSHLGKGTQTIMLLLLLGSMLQVATVDDPLPGAGSLVAIEDPEAHLHPRLVASLWRVVEGMRAQRLVVTHSGDFLAAIPIESIRVLRRRGNTIETHALSRSRLTPDEIRRVAYHVVNRRGTLLFARCWLLVEGETEFWLLPEMARLAGHDFATDGVAVVEFAQSGLSPLIRAAECLGIEWHVLADGDDAGQKYADNASEAAGSAPIETRLTHIQEVDIERMLWNAGYDHVFRGAAYGAKSAHHPRRSERPAQVIRRAVANTSKPHLALAVLDAANGAESPGVPEPLQRAISAAVRLAAGG